MNSTQLKESKFEDESCLKLLVNAINTHGPQYFPGFYLSGNRKRVIAKDFDRLTSDQFVDLVQFIFMGYSTSSLTAALSNDERCEKLQNFMEKLPSARVNFDPRPAALYHALRIFFPKGQDLLLPSVIINPSADPQRTRKVLFYLCRLLVFVDSCGQEFTSVREELQEEASRKRELKTRLDATKTEINTRLLDLDVWKSEVDMLENQSRMKKEEISELSRKAVSLEEAVKEAEKGYRMLEENNKSISRAITAAEKEIEDLKKLIVPNIESITHDHKLELAALEELASTREALGRKIESASNESSRVNEITEEAQSAISDLKDVVNFMEELRDLQTAVQQVKVQKEEKLQSLNELEVKLKDMQDRFSGVTVEVSQKDLDTEIKKINTYKDKLKSLKGQEADLRKEFNVILTKIRNCKNELPSKRSQISDLRESIRQNENFISTDVPRILSTLEQMIYDTLEDLQEEFSELYDYDYDYE